MALALPPWSLALRGLVAALVVQSLTSDTIFFEQNAAAFFFLIGIVGAGISHERLEDQAGANRVSNRVSIRVSRVNAPGARKNVIGNEIR